ncbi:hypothetical protein ROZALSC1DRAFT_21642 [Rozella allomycis CSF55]|uniref:Uncharacterized protein n=1 Tax=Rozella allomycis (strain CSF55) TaxID=988480 RepID=A0A4V1J033_ROZAC|nr:hypothetical protein ROZALSC1DRAFT_21642 [Rozella allomycis CSF55]
MSTRNTWQGAKLLTSSGLSKQDLRYWKTVVAFKAMKDDFLLYMALMRGNGYTGKAMRIDNINLPEEFANYTIPFLSPPNQVFPTWFDSDDVNVANLRRTRNNDVIDFAVDKLTNNGISTLMSGGECKDYKGPLGQEVVESILLRVPKDSKIHLVLTNDMQRSYYKIKSSKGKKRTKKTKLVTNQKFLEDHPHVNNGKIYKMTESGLESIK